MSAQIQSDPATKPRKPLPPKHRRYRVWEFRRGTERMINSTDALYPFADMQAGDWFKVSSRQVDVERVKGNARTYGSRHRVKFGFITRRYPDGEVVVRVTHTPSADSLRVHYVAPSIAKTIEQELADALAAIPLGEMREIKADRDCEPARITPVKILRAVRLAQDTSTSRFATKRRGNLVVEITRRA